MQVILKASTLDIKHVWVRRIRQLIQETYFGNKNVPSASLMVPHTNRPGKTVSQRSSRSAGLQLSFY